MKVHTYLIEKKINYLLFIENIQINELFKKANKTHKFIQTWKDLFILATYKKVHS